jgi:hypothetical protein
VHQLLIHTDTGRRRKRRTRLRSTSVSDVVTPALQASRATSRTDATRAPARSIPITSASERSSMRGDAFELTLVDLSRRPPTTIPDFRSGR